MESASAYDLLADRWLDARFNRADGIAQHRRALGFLEGSAPGWALLAGCGCNTRFHALLRERGLRIEGVDVSARMIELGRAADAEAVLHHADLCDWPLPRRYRFIAGWDSLWHRPSRAS